MRVVPPKRPRLAKVEAARSMFFPLGGGEDLVTPALEVNPGFLRFSLNYEPGMVQGYRRIDGFERYDGRPIPSAASYWVLNFNIGTAAFSVGETITGATSAASGKALVVTVTSGSWAGGNAAGYVILYGVSGTFQNAETITSAGGSAKANGTATQRGATTDANDSTWLHAAIEATRTAIQTVPGSGNIRGVWVFNGTRYAFRDYGTPATECRMYKATAAGWTQVALGTEIQFTAGGTATPVDGATLTQGGVTATVHRVMTRTGTWAGTAAGTFVISTPSGGNFAAGAATLTGGATVTLSGVQTSIALQPGGRYEFINYNFRGSSSTQRMYGCDGVNLAFEFDGTYYCPIRTGMTTDTPKHIAAHKKHLFLAFPGGSAQHSGVGDPFAYTAVTGAAELGTGDEITGFQVVPGGVLAIFNRNATYLLYGSSSLDWDLRTHAEDSGAIEWSIQPIGAPRYLDDRGMTSLEAVQQYGDFNAATFSEQIQPLIDAKLSDSSISVTASLRARSKNQYRIYFSDGSGIVAKFRSNRVEFTRINYGKTVYCACSSEDSNGREVLLFGSSDGYVYELDAGTSFDGTAIEAYLRLPFGNLKMPQQIKRFYKAVLEIDAPGSCALEFTHELDYGNTGNPRGITQDLNVDAGGGYWGISEWSSFIWGGQAVGTAEGYLEGSGKNIGMFIRSYATYEQPHTINGINLHYAIRGRAR